MLKKSFTNYIKYIYRFSSDQQKSNTLSTKLQDPIDNLLSQDKIQQQINKRQQLLEIRHRELQKIIDDKISFPIKMCGTKDTFSQKFAYLPDRIMSYYNIHPTTITDYLLKMYKASLYAIVDQNQNFMNQYWESGFKQSVLKSIKQAKKKHSISLIEDKNYLKQMTETCEIVDSVLVRGLSIERDKNMPPQQYKKFEEADDVGLITYTPLRITTDNDIFINPSTNKTAFEGYDNVVLRILLRIKSPLRFKISDIQINDQLYTWEHLCVIQNQMVSPKHLQSRYKLETLMEWLGKYRFGMWKIVDIDNFMKGNSLFRNHIGDDQQQLDEMFKGTILDRSSHANIRKF